MSKLQTWDKYFFDICDVVKNNSKCFSRKIGAILVKDNTVIGSGYNCPPRGVPKCDERWEGNVDLYLLEKAESLGYDPDEDVLNRCPRQVLKAKSGEMLDICLACHAERNVLINSARLGIKTKGCILYMSCGIPCFDCFKEIIQAGISEIVVTSMELYDKQTQYLINNSDIKIRLFSHLSGKSF